MLQQDSQINTITAIEQVEQHVGQAETTSETKATSAEDNDTINEEDINNYLANEEDSQDNTPVVIDKKHIPCIGKKFRTHEEARSFFNFYAYQVGFSVVITHHYKSTSKKRFGQITKYTYQCYRYGKNDDGQKKKKKKTQQQRNTQVIDRTDCKCMLTVRLEGDVWRILSMNLNHNHTLTPNREAKFLRSHKHMTDEEKKLIRTLKQCNIPTRNMISILSFLRGGIAALPYTRKDVSNVGTTINSETRNTDMNQVMEYLRQKEAKDPGYYYKLTLDENNKVKSMFWTDGRSTQLYEQYGEFVSFDTTYKTNRYNMPFAPIVGVTGHGNICIFACAFLGDETTETFKWVFETFLTAMGGKHPETIITDQDLAMRAAIRQVFPNSKHRNCLFHILKKCRERSGNTFSDKRRKDLYAEFNDIVHNSLTRAEFESLWLQMIAQYNLENIKYLEIMWRTRKNFIPVYSKTDFCPFIHSTALSEGTNARFKRGVGPTHSVMTFLLEYETINDIIFDTEYGKDYESRNKKPKSFWSNYMIEEQAADLYNHGIFDKFQDELKGTLNLEVAAIQQGKAYEVYAAPNLKQQEFRPRRYVVMTDLPQENFVCICAKFSKDGILCSHVLKVMLYLKMSKIPDKYIIERWRKKERKLTVSMQLATNDENSSVLRFNVLSRRICNMASKASKSKETYEYLLGEIDNLDSNLDLIIEDAAQNQASIDESNTVENTSEDQAEKETTNEQEDIQDPDIANTKGKKSARTKGMVEKIKEQPKKHCTRCGRTSHTIENCPLMRIARSTKKIQKTTTTSKRNE